MTRRTPAALLAAALIALPVLAGCGSGSSSGSGAGSGTTSKTTTSQQSAAGTVRTASTGLGTILVDGQGRTIYLFKRDTGPRSTCSGSCIAAWPAVTTKGAPHATGGAMAPKLGTSMRSDGTTQITYAGHPLYLYAGDASPGQTNGQGLNAFGAKWWAMSPSGAAITTQASGGASGGGGGGGY